MGTRMHSPSHVALYIISTSGIDGGGIHRQARSTPEPLPEDLAGFDRLSMLTHKLQRGQMITVNCLSQLS